MNIIPDRLKWTVFRRRIVAKSVTGFYAHWDTYADPSSTFSEYNKLYKSAWLYDVHLGRFTYLGGAKAKHVTIGAFCSIGTEAVIGGVGRHPTRFISTHPSFYSTLHQSGYSFANEDRYGEFADTSIGNDVWIGMRAVVLDGVTVGNGAIIAAGAIVTKNVPPYTIVAGVPARAVRLRFTPAVIHQLNSWEWWNLPLNILRKLAPEFITRESWSEQDIEKMKMLARKDFEDRSLAR